MIESMKNCYQTDKQNVYEHGLSVWKFYQRILDGEHEGMKIPKWFSDYEHLFSGHEKHHLYSRDIAEKYTTFHDLGKTKCLTIDENGRRHFPNHAAISEQMWLEYGCCPTIGKLIGLDMIFHTEKPEEILERNLDPKILCTLMIAALAELHANAEMFGGITSESFCIKYKKLSKRATFILREIFA
jgi:hypothetical protein